MVQFYIDIKGRPFDYFSWVCMCVCVCVWGGGGGGVGELEGFWKLKQFLQHPKVWFTPAMETEAEMELVETEMETQNSIQTL